MADDSDCKINRLKNVKVGLFSNPEALLYHCEFLKKAHENAKAAWESGDKHSLLENAVIYPSKPICFSVYIRKEKEGYLHVASKEKVSVLICDVAAFEDLANDRITKGYVKLYEKTNLIDETIKFPDNWMGKRWFVTIESVEQTEISFIVY